MDTESTTVVTSNDQAQKKPEFAQVYVERITIRDFRGIDEFTITFEPDITVLVGRNNAGKSRVIRALAIALGAVAATRDDLTVSGKDTATIDVIFAPLVAPGAEESFAPRETRRMRQGGVQIVSEAPIRERFAWRTTIEPSHEGMGVRSRTEQLTYDQTAQGWFSRDNPLYLGQDQRTIVSADLVETKRDLVDELGRRNSPIRRILDDLEIADAKRPALESELESLGSRILTSSASLAAVTSVLDTLANSIGTIGRPMIQPLPIRLEELARAVSIDLDTGNGSLPLRLHGAGTRSLVGQQHLDDLCWLEGTLGTSGDPG